MACGIGFSTSTSAAALPRLVVGRSVPVAVQNSLADVRRAAGLQDWTSCLARAEELQAAAGEALVPVEPGHFVTPQLAVDLAISESIARHQLTVLPAAIQGAGRLLSGEEILRRGEIAWGNGELNAARNWWRLLLPPAGPHRLVHPVPNVAPSIVNARLSLVEQLNSRPRSAAFYLQEVERSEPLAGQLAGRTGLLADLLKQQLVDPANWPGALPGDNPLEWPATTSADVKLLSRLWTLPLGSRPEIRLIRSPGEEETWLTISPSSVQKYAIGPDQSSVEMTSHYELTGPARSIAQQATLIGEELYLRMGAQGLEAGVGKHEPPNEFILVNLSVSDEVHPCWTLTGEQIMEEPGWRVSGDPVVHDDRLTVALRSTGDAAQIGAAQLDCRSGDVIWRRSYGTLAEASPQTHISCDQLLIGPQVDSAVPFGHAPANLVLLLPEGECMGLCLKNGRPLWSRSLAETSSRPRTTSVSSCIDSGNLYVLSPDMKCVCLSLVEGATIWNESTSSASSQVVGVCDDVVLLAGTSLKGVNRFDGSLTWTTAPLSSWREGHGAAVLFGRQVIWSASDRLWLLDALTGTPLKSWRHELLGTCAGELNLMSNRIVLRSHYGWVCFEAGVPVLPP